MLPRICRLLLVAAAVLVSGCAWQQQSRLERFDSAYSQADFSEAAELAGRFGDTDKATGASADLLWTLQQASALQAAGDHAAAVRLFDTTERFFRIYDERGALRIWSGQLLSVLSNETLLDYQGTVYDAIMVNSYKALNFLAQGKPALARVELNRARDRQRRAADYFAEELAEARDRMTRRQGSGSSPAVTDTTIARALDDAEQSLRKDYDRLEEWSIYPAFINPLATYLDGLFRLTHAEAPSDYGQAADALREVRGMVPELAVADEDWRWAEDLATGRRRLEDLPPTVWILYENGLGPVRREQRVQLPLVLFNRNGPVFWTGIAYPVLETRSQARPALSARIGDREPVRTDTLVNMDAVIGNEFRQRLPTVLTRSVVAAAIKAAGHYRLQEEAHPLVALLGFFYQVASTQADTRQWTSLPKTIELAKLERPSREGSPTGENQGGGDVRRGGAADQLVLSEDLAVALPDSRFTLVWVLQPTAGTEPAVTVIPLGDRPLGQGPQEEPPLEPRPSGDL